MCSHNKPFHILISPYFLSNSKFKQTYPTIRTSPHPPHPSLSYPQPQKNITIPKQPTNILKPNPAQRKNKTDTLNSTPSGFPSLRQIPATPFHNSQPSPFLLSHGSGRLWLGPTGHCPVQIQPPAASLPPLSALTTCEPTTC